MKIAFLDDTNGYRWHFAGAVGFHWSIDCSSSPKNALKAFDSQLKVMAMCMDSGFRVSRRMSNTAMSCMLLVIRLMSTQTAIGKHFAMFGAVIRGNCSSCTLSIHENRDGSLPSRAFSAIFPMLWGPFWPCNCCPIWWSIANGWHQSRSPTLVAAIEVGVDLRNNWIVGRAFFLFILVNLLVVLFILGGFIVIPWRKGSNWTCASYQCTNLSNIIHV